MKAKEIFKLLKMSKITYRKYNNRYSFVNHKHLIFHDLMLDREKYIVRSAPEALILGSEGSKIPLNVPGKAKPFQLGEKALLSPVPSPAKLEKLRLRSSISTVQLGVKSRVLEQKSSIFCCTMSSKARHARISSFARDRTT